MITQAAKPVLSVRGLHVSFANRAGLLRSAPPRHVVRNVSFDLFPSSVLALVGESGCGKTTIARGLLGLLPETAKVSGHITCEGKDVLALGGAELKIMRRRMQVVFQDPGGSMNPGMTIENIVGEPLDIHESAITHAERTQRIDDSLTKCGLSSAFLQRLPNELSGGQRQRVCIARALMTRPTVLICDEPTSALDVSVQAQSLNLLNDLRASLGLACLFITHDMGVVRQLADHVCVMQSGEIVEDGPAATLLDSPQHPYSRQLLSAVPGKCLDSAGHIVPSPANL